MNFQPEEARLVLVCEKIRLLIGPERYEVEIRPLLKCTETEALILLMRDIKVSEELTLKSNVELAEMMISVWANLPINSPVALLVSEVVDRLMYVKKTVRELK